MHGIRVTAKLDNVTYQVKPGKAQWFDPLSRI